MAAAERVTEVEGVVTFMRSQSDGPLFDADDCICCDGPHIFARCIDVEPEPGRAAGVTRKHYSAWISDALFDNGLEGRRVRVVLEVLPR